LEPQGELTGEATTITDYSTRELTGEPTGELIGEAAREAISITGESTDKSTGNAQTAEAQAIHT
jgi:hypothetical protein